MEGGNLKKTLTEGGLTKRCRLGKAILRKKEKNPLFREERGKERGERMGLSKKNMVRGIDAAGPNGGVIAGEKRRFS